MSNDQIVAVYGDNDKTAEAIGEIAHENTTPCQLRSTKTRHLQIIFRLRSRI